MPAPLFNPANLFSLARILLVPLFVWLTLEDYHVAALWVFVFASLTDWVDGWLARRFGWVTPLGVVLDPIGDKLVVLSASIVLAALKEIPAWMAAVAVGREVLMVSGIVLLATYADKNNIRRAVNSTIFGKVCSALVMAGLALVLAHLAGLFPPGWERPLEWGLGTALVLNFVSGVDYAVAGFRYYGHYRDEEKP